MIFLVQHVYMHYRRVTNRAGVAVSFAICMLFIIQGITDALFNVDTKKVHHEYETCRIGSEEMASVIRHARLRAALVVAGQVVACLGAAW